MEKEVRTTLWIQDDAVRFEAHFKDFDGGLQKWKDSFYQLWRWQMTWSFAYSIRVDERREVGVYVSLLVQKGYRERVKDLLDDLGYKNITENDEHIGVVELYGIDAPEADDMFEVIAE